MQEGNTTTKTVSVKWFLITVGLVAVLGFAAWVWQSTKCARISEQCDQRLRAAASRTAETTARTIATFGHEQIVANNWETLQEYADNVVKAKSLAYIVILNSNGIATIHTDRSFKGSKLGEPKPDKNIVYASVPAMGLTKQVATVRVGVNVD